MVNVLGYDIGGANTKAAFIHTGKGKLLDTRVAMEYFPIWMEPEKLASVLLTLKERLGINALDGVGVTMTAELSDVFPTKREGVHYILKCVKTAFPHLPIHVLNTEAKLETIKNAEADPFGVAAANWAATGWLIAQKIKDCVVVDVGSTSASIIPIVNGQVAAKGKTDLDKLICGELVYTGSLRTNVAAIVHSIPIRNGIAKVASELFALSGDVHLILGNITAKDYTCKTADGRGKSLPEALTRLARIVCADTEMLTQPKIINMAKYIYDKQVLTGCRKLKQSLLLHKNTQKTNEVPVVVTGLGQRIHRKKSR